MGVRPATPLDVTSAEADARLTIVRAGTGGQPGVTHAPIVLLAAAEFAKPDGPVTRWSRARLARRFGAIDRCARERNHHPTPSSWVDLVDQRPPDVTRNPAGRSGAGPSAAS